MTKIYVCHSMYHIYTSIIKTIVNNEKDSELILTDTINNLDELSEGIRQSGLYRNIYITPFSIGKFPSRPFRYRKLYKIVKPLFQDIELEKKEIFIYNDWSVIGWYLNLEKIRYHLLEDGLNCYQKGGLMEQELRMCDSLKYKIRRCINWGVFDRSNSPYTIDLEVNDKRNLCDNIGCNIKEVSKKGLAAELGSNRRILFDIFAPNTSENAWNEEEERVSLLLTQPLYADRIVKSEMMQVKLYRKLIKDHAEGRVWIKVHPRDTVEYKKYFPECRIVEPKYMPVELLGLMPEIHLSKIITAFSTSIDALDLNCPKVRFSLSQIQNMCKEIKKDYNLI